MKKTIGTILFVAYVIIAITVTILLLSFNEYMCSEIGGYTLCIVRDELLEPKYSKGDLLIIKQSKDLSINVNDRIVLYQNINSDDYRLHIGNVTSKAKVGTRQTIFVINNTYEYDSSYLIGKESDITVIPKIGTILSILESRWGYLFSIVIVTLLLLLQELYDLFIEIKYGNTTEKESVKGSR